jgi:hypothetical protein
MLTFFRMYVKTMWWFLKIGCLILILCIPGVAIYDQYHPWPVATEALKVESDSNWRLCVGIADGSKTYSESVGYGSVDELTETYQQRSYLLLSPTSSMPQLITISVDRTGLKVKNDGLWDLILFLLFYAFCVFFVIKFLILPLCRNTNTRRQDTP